MAWLWTCMLTIRCVYCKPWRFSFRQCRPPLPPGAQKWHHFVSVMLVEVECVAHVRGEPAINSSKYLPWADGNVSQSTQMQGSSHDLGPCLNSQGSSKYCTKYTLYERPFQTLFEAFSKAQDCGGISWSTSPGYVDQASCQHRKLLCAFLAGSIIPGLQSSCYVMRAGGPYTRSLQSLQGTRISSSLPKMKCVPCQVGQRVVPWNSHRYGNVFDTIGIDTDWMSMRLCSSTNTPNHVLSA